MKKAKGSKKKSGKRSMGWNVRKYYRFMRLYMKRVRAVETELGEEIYAC